MVVCPVQCKVSIFFFLFPLIKRFLLNLDLVDNRICDARILAHVQRERCTMTSEDFSRYFNCKIFFFHGIS